MGSWNAGWMRHGQGSYLYFYLFLVYLNLSDIYLSSLYFLCHLVSCKMESLVLKQIAKSFNVVGLYFCITRFLHLHLES